MTDPAYKQAMYLCRLIPNLEWSGYILYREHGNIITDPDNFWLECLEVFPMSKGSSVAVEQSPDVAIAQHLGKYLTKGEMPPKYGTIHSHHSMGVFFSGTDYNDLEENAKLHNYYLSIVVDNYGKLHGHIGSIVEKRFEGSVINYVRDGEGISHPINDPTPYTSSSQELIDYECNMEFTTPEYPEWFIERSKTITTKTKPVSNYKNSFTNPNQKYPKYGKYFAKKSHQTALPFDYDDNTLTVTGYTRRVVEEFVTKWIALDKNWESSINGTFQSVYSGEITNFKKQGAEKYQQQLINNFDSIYINVLGAMDDDEVVFELLNQCIDILLENSTYPNTRDMIIEAIHFLISTDYSDKKLILN